MPLFFDADRCCNGRDVRGRIFKRGQHRGDQLRIERGQVALQVDHQIVTVLGVHFAQRLMDASLVLPAYEMILKCSHTFNLLDARGAISVTERQAYIGRIRKLAQAVAQSYYESRERLGFPMLGPGGKAAA